MTWINRLRDYVEAVARRIVRPRFLTLFVLPNLLFVILALTSKSETLIGFLNAALTALAAGVVVAYHRPVMDMLFSDEPIEGSDWLALGIFLSWLGVLDIRLGSIAWRMAGRPDAWENNTSIPYGLFLSLCAGAFHLAAKGAMGRKQVPTQRWIRIGALIASGVFAFILLGYALDWLGIIKPGA